MAEEEAKKVEVEVEVAQEPEAAPAPAAEPAKEDVAEEKAVIPATEPPAAEEKPAADSKALAIVESKYYLLSSVAHHPPLSLSLSLSLWNWKACDDGKVARGGVLVCATCHVLGIGRNLLPLHALFRRLCASW